MLRTAGTRAETHQEAPLHMRSRGNRREFNEKRGDFERDEGVSASNLAGGPGAEQPGLVSAAGRARSAAGGGAAKGLRAKGGDGDALGAAEDAAAALWSPGAGA